jgi:hypothetical protein
MVPSHGSTSASTSANPRRPVGTTDRTGCRVNPPPLPPKDNSPERDNARSATKHQTPSNRLTGACSIDHGPSDTVFIRSGVHPIRCSSDPVFIRSACHHRDGDRNNCIGRVSGPFSTGARCEANEAAVSASLLQCVGERVMPRASRFARFFVSPVYLLHTGPSAQTESGTDRGAEVIDSRGDEAEPAYFVPPANCPWKRGHQAFTLGFLQGDQP